MECKNVNRLRAQVAQIICPLPETTPTVAAVACADAAGVKSIAITSAVNNVVLSLSKTTSSFTKEYRWIRMDAGNLSLALSAIPLLQKVATKSCHKKRGGSRSSPPELNQLLSCLVAAVFGRRRVDGGTCVGVARIVQDNRQVTHGEITCTNIADERKAVSELEVANCDHVALEVRGDGLQSVGPNRAGGNVASVALDRRNGRCGGGTTVPVQFATAGLCGCAERVRRGIRNRDTGVEAGLVGYVRIQQDGTADVNCEDTPSRGTTCEAGSGQRAGSQGGRWGGGEAQSDSGRGSRRQSVGGGGDVDRELKCFSRVRVGVHHFPHPGTSIVADGDFSDRHVARGSGVGRGNDRQEAADIAVWGGFTIDELSETDIGDARGRVNIARAAACRSTAERGRDRGCVVVHVTSRHEDARAGRNVTKGRLQTGSIICQTSELGADREHKVGFGVVD